MVSFDLPEAFSSILEPDKVSLLDVIADSLMALVLPFKRHLLPGLLQLHFAPFQVSVDGVAKDGDLRVEPLVFSVVKLGLKTVVFGTN